MEAPSSSSATLGSARLTQAGRVISMAVCRLFSPAGTNNGAEM